MGQMTLLGFLITKNAAMVWLGLMIILGVIELLTLGLTSIWFAAGALVAFIVAMIGLRFSIQLIVFVVVSLVLLFFTRPLAQKYLNSETTKTNAEALIGRTVRVTGDVSNLKDEGQVTVNGLEWTARSSDDTQVFRKGDLVKIIRIEGVKLIVEKSDEIEKGE